jgi:dihydroorotate dehydrogenase subfamily 2
MIKSSVIGFLYRTVAKPLLFKTDPEWIHDIAIKVGAFSGKYKFTRGFIKSCLYYSNASLEQDILGIHFPNPIGLAAGFDKDARMIDATAPLGFGFTEIGSITGEPCLGNPKPRLWRLPKSEGLVVYYGLKNDGCEKISARLKNKHFKIPVGTSFAKTNSSDVVTTEAGIADYVKAYKTFVDIGAYSVINISCPNAFGGQPFSDPNKLELLMKEIAKIHSKKPLFLKLPPDLPNSDTDKIIEIARKHGVKGFICTNLSKDKNNPAIKDKNVPDVGGVSGRPAAASADKMISYVYGKTHHSTSSWQGGEFVIIGCGGIFTAEDAYRKIKLGASLVQLITSMIFMGPQVVGEINEELVRLMKKDGYKNIGEAVGVGCEAIASGSNAAVLKK